MKTLVSTLIAAAFGLSSVAFAAEEAAPAPAQEAAAAPAKSETATKKKTHKRSAKRTHKKTEAAPATGKLSRSGVEHGKG